MESTLSRLLGHLDEFATTSHRVLHWGSPVPAFGNITSATIATVGLNPSNREFVDSSGVELEGEDRRFHTLTSLGLARWQDATEEHLCLIRSSFDEYFDRNPFDKWFKKIDSLLGGIEASYYPGDGLFDRPKLSACHLDLIPYATECKWVELSSEERRVLLDTAGDVLGQVLRDSSIKLLILNGRTVVDRFQEISGALLEEFHMQRWALPRANRNDVRGYSYSGIVSSLHGIDLGREIHVIGFNHNIQSSYGVTNEIMASIRDWITKHVEDCGL